MRQKNWAETPFGPIEGWSQALKSAVSICLGSRFPMVLYWGETRALIYNDAWSAVPGRKHPWALGRPGFEVWSEIWDIIGPMFDHVMDTGEATWSEDQLLPLNRFGYVEECYFYYSYSPVRGEDGRVEGIFTAVTETTYRVLSERRERLLRQSAGATSGPRSSKAVMEEAARLLATLPEESPFSLIYQRDAATGTLRRAALQGLDESDSLAPAEIGSGANATPWPFERAVEQPERIEGLAQRLPACLPGRPWPEPPDEAIVVPLSSSRPDAPYGFLVSGISPRRRLDTDYVTFFQRMAAHISTALINVERYEEERRRAEQLAELDRAKTVFFSNASHEFRTPLTLMLGPLEDILSRSDAGGQLPVERPELELIQRNGQRLLRLVNTLLDFSRIEAGRVKAHFVPVDLCAYTAELASSFRSAMTRAGLEYQIDCMPLGEPVWIDREMWEKIVLNLISNAFKYTLSGHVRVSLSRQGESAVLSVIDSGVGIPTSELDKVFDRFHRIDGQTGRTHEGTGIGLALVKDLSKLHGGDVHVRSQIGIGTVFEVRLPFGRDHVPAQPIPADTPIASTATRAETFVAEALRWLPDAEQSPQATLAPPAGITGHGHGERIVLADDNADMRNYVQRLLQEAGYAVEAVSDGRAAIDAALEMTPDLILSDVMMPVLDGFGLIRTLRNDPDTRDVPIILLSARAGEEASIEGIAAGADDYLVKPFSARELIARVEGALRLAKLRRDVADTLREANEVLETRVRERTRERDQLWAYSQDMIGVATTQGVWLSVNPAWTRVLGWEAGDIVGQPTEWFVHPEDLSRTIGELASLAGGTPTMSFENRFRTRSGTYRTLSWTAMPEGGLLYCVARDVTLDRDRAVELEQAKDALRQSQKMEAIGQLTGGIAHDFNNLLTGILGALQMLQRGPCGQEERAQRYIKTAVTSAERAAALTQRLLSFGRRQTLDLQPAQVNRLVIDMEYLLQRTLTENIQLELKLSSDAWLTRTDVNQLESALLNLCINARDAMEAGGRLSIATTNVSSPKLAMSAERPQGDFVAISVSDTGHGIPAHLMDKIFEPFFTTKPVGKGTGLGLSMVYGFVRQIGGYVDVETAIGKGTRVDLYLPRHNGSADMPSRASQDVPDGLGERILVVEDEPDVRMLVLDVLQDLGYRASEAPDATAALTLFEVGNRFDLVISDIGLPGVSGRELADRLRVYQPDVGILFITGYAEGALDLRAFLGQGMHLLSKPFSIDTLGGKVREILEARQ